MAHPQQEAFCKSVKRRFPDFFVNKFVLDIGSLDINGNNQYLFDDCQYIGVDLAIGRNVDIVTEGHNLSLPANTFDLIVSTECFEHDRFYGHTLKNIVRLLKPGGMLLFTCATTGRPEHGTLRTTSQDAPFLAQFGEWANYYKNLDESDIRKVLDIESVFSQYEFGIGQENFDLYFWGIKAGNLAPRTDYSFQVKANSLRVQIQSLQHVIGAKNQSLSNFIERVTGLERSVAKLSWDETVRSAELATVNQQNAILGAKIDELHRSRSWRITAPLRRLAVWARYINPPWPKLGPFSRLVVALCVFPATFYHYRGWRKWFHAVTTGKSFLAAVLNRPDESRAGLAKSSRLAQVFVSSLLSIALRIKINGGLVPTLRHMYRVVHQEGVRGIQRRVSSAPKIGFPAKPTMPDPPSPWRILVMDYRVPMADISAGERATVGILRDLRAVGFDVVFVPYNMYPDAKHEKELTRFGVKVITAASGYQSPEQYIREHGHTFAAFYLIRLEIVEAVLDTVRQFAPSGRVIFHAPDLYFLRERREAAISGVAELQFKSEATRERELAVMQRVDHTVIVSPAELGVLREYLPEAPISVFPVLYAPVVANPAPFDGREHVFYLGGFTHRPNVDAVCWFVAEIWPRVRERLPDVEFHIVGSEMPQSVLELSLAPGVAIRGFVKDLGPLFSSMRVGVAPLRFGAGIKGKIALTLGAGIPCVCTHVAAEGMGLEDGLSAHITDDPEAFAERIVRLYTDRADWERLSRNGMAVVRARFGEDANRASLLGVLNEARVLPAQTPIDHRKES